MTPTRWCLNILAATLILSLSLPPPALALWLRQEEASPRAAALRPAGLEEADPALQVELEQALTGLEETLSKRDEVERRVYYWQRQGLAQPIRFQKWRSTEPGWLWEIVQALVAYNDVMAEPQTQRLPRRAFLQKVDAVQSRVWATMARLPSDVTQRLFGGRLPGRYDPEQFYRVVFQTLPRVAAEEGLVIWNAMREVFNTRNPAESRSFVLFRVFPVQRVEANQQIEMRGETLRFDRVFLAPARLTVPEALGGDRDASDVRALYQNVVYHPDAESDARVVAQELRRGPPPEEIPRRREMADPQRAVRYLPDNDPLDVARSVAELRHAEWMRRISDEEFLELDRRAKETHELGHIRRQRQPGAEWAKPFLALPSVTAGFERFMEARDRIDADEEWAAQVESLRHGPPQITVVTTLGIATKPIIPDRPHAHRLGYRDGLERWVRLIAKSPNRKDLGFVVPAGVSPEAAVASQLWRLADQGGLLQILTETPAGPKDGALPLKPSPGDRVPEPATGQSVTPAPSHQIPWGIIGPSGIAVIAGIVFGERWYMGRVRWNALIDRLNVALNALDEKRAAGWVGQLDLDQWGRASFEDNTIPGARHRALQTITGTAMPSDPSAEDIQRAETLRDIFVALRDKAGLASTGNTLDSQLARLDKWLKRHQADAAGVEEGMVTHYDGLVSETGEVAPDEEIRAGLEQPGQRRAVVEVRSGIHAMDRVFYHPGLAMPDFVGVEEIPLTERPEAARAVLQEFEAGPRDLILLPGAVVEAFRNSDVQGGH